MRTSHLILVAMASLPVCASAQVAVVAKAGTLGLGADIVAPIFEHANARVGANLYNVNRNLNRNGIDYEGKGELRSVSVLGDWFPIRASAFRLTGGLMYNGNKGKLHAKPMSGSTYEFNGTTYQASDVGTADGDISWRRMAPYLGIGWGNPVERATDWSFNMDVGVMFQGAPHARLNVTCGAALPQVQCDQLQSDAAAEEAKLKSDTRKYRLFPVLSLGIGKKF